MNKIKLILIGLIALSLISMIYSFSILNSKEQLKKEFQFVREELTRENQALASKASEALEEKRKAEGRLDELKAQIEKTSSEKQELQDKYNQLSKEREELLEKLKRTSATSFITPPAASLAAPAAQAVPEDAYWAGVLKEKAALELQLSNIKTQLGTINMTSEELKKDKAVLELEITNFSRDKQDLERRLVYNEKIIDGLSAELVREKNDKRMVEAELKNLKNENLGLTRKLKSLTEEKLNLEKKLYEAQGSKEEMDKRISEMNTLLEKKILEVEEIRGNLGRAAGIGVQGQEEIPLATEKESVELPPIVVRTQEDRKVQVSTAQEYSKFEGKVLAVNREHNFIVIDLGEEQLVREGKTFNVFRGGKRIATTEVIQVRKSVSACDIKQQDSPIKVGDIVR